MKQHKGTAGAATATLFVPETITTHNAAEFDTDLRYSHTIVENSINEREKQHGRLEIKRYRQVGIATEGEQPKSLP